MQDKDKDALRAPSPASTMVGPKDDMGSHEEKDKEAKPKGKRYKVTIHSSNGDNSDVLICHNYVCNQYKRNVEVDMDENYLQVLKDAVVSTTVQSPEGVSSAVTIPQYSYTLS